MKCLLTCILVSTLAAVVAANDDWPQWRGARLDSLGSEDSLPDAFSDSNRLWELELPGPGGASPVIWKDQIFVASVDGDDLVLMKVNRDGKIVWKQNWQAKIATSGWIEPIRPALHRLPMATCLGHDDRRNPALF